jgi:hypothetical protein
MLAAPSKARGKFNARGRSKLRARFQNSRDPSHHRLATAAAERAFRVKAAA